MDVFLPVFVYLKLLQQFLLSTCLWNVEEKLFRCSILQDVLSPRTHNCLLKCEWPCMQLHLQGTWWTFEVHQAQNGTILWSYFLIWQSTGLLWSVSVTPADARRAYEIFMVSARNESRKLPLKWIHSALAGFYISKNWSSVDGKFMQLCVVIQLVPHKSTGHLSSKASLL